MNKYIVAAIAFIFAWIVLVLGLYATVGYTIFHFVKKFW